MKIIRSQPGGYPRTMDMMLSLQTEMLEAINAQLANLGRDMVLKGCAVTNNNNGTVSIASGIMYVSGQVVRFDGATNVAANGSQAIVVGSTVDSNRVQFGDQTTHPLYTEQKAVIVAQDPNNNSQMKVTTSLYTLQQYMAEQVNAAVTTQINNSVSSIVNNSVQTLINASYPKGSIKEFYDLSGNNAFLNNFDSTGKGIVSPWVGWALDNGQNGTPGSAGRTTVGVGQYIEPASGINLTLTSGQTLGEAAHILNINEMPAHAHSSLILGTDNSLTTSSGGHRVPSLDTSGGAIQIGTTGGSVAHNNMQPTIVVYRIVKIV